MRKFTAMQPQITIKDYSPKSVVLRTTPDDYLKPYAGHLTELGGKWGPYLKEPPGSQNVLAGWIFQKTKENELRQLISQITAGQVPQAPPKYSPAPAAAPTFTSNPHPTIFGSLNHSGLVRATAPIKIENKGHQSIEVIKPETGGILKLLIAGQEYPVKVESVQEEQGVVVSAIILLPDGQKTQIALQKPRWEIPGLTQNHTILL